MKIVLLFGLMSLMSIVGLRAQCMVQANFLNPKLTSDDLKSIVYLNDTLAYTIGTGTTLLKTVDTGENWSIINTDFPGYQVVYEMFANEAKDSLFIYGSSIFIFNPQNETISVVEVPQTVIKFIISPEKKWFIVTNYGEGYVSSNQGADWSLLSGLDNIYNGYQFLENGVGYALSSSKLYKSLNGGITWGLHYSDANYYNSLEVVGNRIIMGRHSGLSLSDDDGATWQFKPFDDFTGSMTKMEFSDELYGYVLVHNTSTYKSSFMLTDDGGNTWSKLDNFENSFNQWISDFEIVGTTAWLVGRFGLIASIDLNNLDWRKYAGDKASFISSLAQMPDGSLVASAYKSQLISINLENDSLGYDTLNFETDFRQIEVVNEDSTFLLDDKNLFRSFDGGKNWENVFSSADYLFGFSTSNSGRNMLMTMRNNISFSNDYGTSWVDKNPLVSYSANFDVSGSTILNDSVWFVGVAGDYGALLKTEDRGNTWEEVIKAELSYAAFLVFDFVTDSVGYATGNYDVFYKTIDAGNTWTPVPFSGSNIVGNIDFYSEYIGVASTGGNIMMTRDGGNSWNNIYNEYSNQFEDIIMLDEYSIIAVGRGGLIVHLVGDKLPPIELTFEENSCLGSELDYSVNFEENIIYNLFVDNQLISNTNSVSINWMDLGQGSFEVVLIRQNTCGIIDSVYKSVEIKDNPELPIISLENDTLFVQNSIDSILWYLNDGLIEAENNYFYVPSEIGVYNVSSTNYCGITVSEDFGFGVVTSIDNQLYPEVSLYPNPNNGLLHIAFNNYDKKVKRIEIWTLNGRLVYEKNYSNNNISLDLMTLGVQRGSYIVKTKQGSMESRKLLLYR
ncbi:MAG: YCF48-related protein [Cyclobacteriaceae bacterium]|nr:YCF48-related protein [Cyclobacteriaceae bacterium]